LGKFAGLDAKTARTCRLLRKTDGIWHDANHMESLPFEELAAFIRDWAQVPVEQPIGLDTRFEDDLGITGDDGGALLQAVEKRFAVQLSTIEDGYRK
jgi:hypothetical protein